MPSLGETTAALARVQAPRASAPRTPTSASSLRERQFSPNPGALRMLAYIPEGLPRGAPLVVALHGCGQSAENFAVNSGWLTLARTHSFAFLAPEQTSANNPNRCFNWFQPDDTAREGGEAGSIHAMVEALLAEHGLDPARIYVTGLSAGGAMASALLAAYPARFAGGAVIAGLPYGAAGSMHEAFAAMFMGKARPARDWGDAVRAASSHEGPWPRISIWHGDADRTVAFVNADQLVRQWSDVHGLSPAPTRRDVVNGHERLVWETEAGEPALEFFRIAGLGHGVPQATTGPDGLGAPGPFHLEAGISSSFEIAKFWGLLDAPAPTGRAGQRGAASVGEARARPGIRAEPNAAAKVASGKFPAGKIASGTVAAGKRAADPGAARPDAAGNDLASRPEAAMRRANHTIPAHDAKSKRRLIDIEGVIAKALRAAGLMK